MVRDGRMNAHSTGAFLQLPTISASWERLFQRYKPFSPATRFEDQARALIDAKVPVFSFIFGIPPKEILQECEAKHIVTIGTATTPRRGCGTSRGRRGCDRRFRLRSRGHRGSFLRAADDSLTGTFSLVPRIADTVNVPVIAAGGIADARGLIAALALGAEAVQMGTAFPGVRGVRRQPPSSSGSTREKSRAHRADEGLHRQTRAGIHNRLLEELNRPGIEILPYPLQRALVRNLAVPAEAAGRSDLLPMGWAKCQSFSLF